MKQFLIRIFIFACCLFAIDALAGVIFPNLVANAKGGDNWRNNYICNETKEEILIFGSSRAIHHYNPNIISDSLKMSCYNCGQDGNGIILNFARYNLILQRHAPQIIVYDVLPIFDLLSGDDNHKYLKWLKAYYDRKDIPQIFESVDKTEKIKMMSNLYRYNSSFVQIVSDCIHPLQSSGKKGFRPLYGEMDRMKISKKELNDDTTVYDNLKLSYINKFIHANKNVKVIFVISPTWDGMDSSQYSPIQKICNDNGLLFINFADDQKYIHNYKYFKDGSHLNAVGADEFTKDLMKILKSKGL